MSPALKSDAVMGVVRKAFKPEFLNRLDNIVMFDPLSLEDLSHIVGINLERLNKRLAERRIRVDVTDAARIWLGERGFDPVYGARPLRRLIQTTIEDQLAKLVLAGTIGDGSTVTFDVTEDHEGLRVV
jgi:ATP-dependent Clp protease ATP-binding subunit ClpB